MTWNINSRSKINSMRSVMAMSLSPLFLQTFALIVFFFCAYGANAQTILNPGATVNLTMTQGQAFSQNFAGTGTQDNVYTLNGSLPPGLGISTIAPPPPATFNHEMLLSGTPTNVGIFSFNIDVSATFFSVPVNYTTTIVVTVLPSPPVANTYNLVVLQNSAANVFTPGTSGSVTGISLATFPAHGSATISGLSISYTPLAGYVGSDTFSYQAIGPGGTSSAANISVTVNPLPPAVASSSVVVNANSGSNTITPNITGTATSINLLSSPAHGVASVSGLGLVYTPSPGYVGSDSMTISVTGPGGTSAPATIAVTVNPPPPTVASSSVTVPANSSANSIVPVISGAATNLIVVNSPAHGTVSVSGLELSYTPSAGYFGSDNLKIAVTGPGGTSSTATISIVISPPPPTVLAGSFSVFVDSVNNFILPLINGTATSISIITSPSHGAASVSGLGVSYTPVMGYIGSDTMVVTATGPGGTSAPSTISISVAERPPIATGRSVDVSSNSNANNISPAIIGVASSINIRGDATNGNVLVSGLTVLYTPRPNFVGSDSVTLTVSGPGGISNSVTISINVTNVSNAAPIVADMNLAFPLNSSANLINPLVSGVATGLSIINPPAHGVVSVNGFSLRYTPVAGYVGNDTIGIAAIGPGGSSALANITISVTAMPPVVAESSFTVPMDSADNLIRPQITGTASTISIVNGALHGTTTVDGLGIRYTPNRNYVGVDVFSVNATGPGGTSEPALVSISVLSTVPKLDPISITVAKDSREIRISPVITGNASSLNIISGPSHGLITLNGLELRYTPNAGFSGTDQVVISATGANGNSPPVSLSITVIPEFPSILPMTVSVPKNSSANQIKPSLSGNVSTVSVVTSPLHGVISVSGLGVIYTPNTGFVGTDTVLVVANGVNASSSPALITINVQAEPPKLSDATAQVAANSISNVIAPKISGEATALQIVDAASHGNLIVRGLELLYTPASGFVGTDSVTVSASGNFGTSNLAKITITVQAISGATNTSVVQANSTANILPILNLEGVQSLNISGQPTQGSVVVQGLGLSYTPKQNYVGPDSVSYSLLGSNGSFASGTIQISVVAAAPVLKNANLTVETGRSGSIDLASLISGPTFSGVSIRLNGAPAHGVASVNGTLVTYTSTVGYVGTDSLQLTATAVGGTSNVAQLMITVIPRPDPSKDPGVLAMFAANTAAVRHFEQTQIEHFNGRMLSLASQSAAVKSAGEQKNERECGAISYWVSGLNSTGRYRTVNGLKYSTLGFSAGGDRCFAGGQTHIGFGVGYARDHSESERDLSFMKATANTAASYLTTQLLPSMRFSFMLGVNQIQDRFARFEDNDLSLAYGEWKGSQMISSGAISSDLSFGKIILVPYVRLDMAKLKLDPFSESGDGDYLLHYHKQTMLSQRSTLGFNSEMKVATSWGELIPRLKVELQRDFARRDSLKINYIDVPDAVYLVPNNDLDRRMILISLGADMMWKNGMVTIINFTHSNANAGNKANRLNLRVSYQY